MTLIKRPVGTRGRAGQRDTSGAERTGGGPRVTDLSAAWVGRAPPNTWGRAGRGFLLEGWVEGRAAEGPLGLTVGCGARTLVYLLLRVPLALPLRRAKRPLPGVPKPSGYIGVRDMGGKGQSGCPRAPAVRKRPQKPLVPALPVGVHGFAHETCSEARLVGRHGQPPGEAHAGKATCCPPPQEPEGDGRHPRVLGARPGLLPTNSHRREQLLAPPHTKAKSG